MAVQFSRLGESSAVQRRQRLLMIGGGSIAFSLFVVVGLLAYSYTTVEAREDITASSPANSDAAFGTVILYAPVARISKGAKISEGSVREVHWPRDQVPAGAVRNREDIVGMFSTAALSANQPILRTSVAVNSPSFGIGELLPAGHRAVTVKVDAISGVEGWARAGAHVDVLLTYIDPVDGISKTRVAVEDAVVLSYGGNIDRKQDTLDGLSTGQTIAATVTLAMPLQDSLKTQTATAMGQITLALRNSNDINASADVEFAATDWDGPKPKEKEETGVAKGFARYTDRRGNDQEFVLDESDPLVHVGGYRVATQGPESPLAPEFSRRPVPYVRPRDSRDARSFGLSRVCVE